MADNETRPPDTDVGNDSANTTETTSQRRTIDKLHLVNFTAFRDLQMAFSPGINAIIGENGTGKTHILKVLYACCTLPRMGPDFEMGLQNYFIATFWKTWNLVNIDADPRRASVRVTASDGVLSYDVWDHGATESKNGNKIGHSTTGTMSSEPFKELPSVLIPAKEMLSHRKHFLETYAARTLYFEKQYIDILNEAGLGPAKSLSPACERLLQRVSTAIGGDVEEFFDVFHVVNPPLYLELTLVAEGLRKFVLLWLLIRNSSIGPGSILYWDEPEANLNPKLMRKMVEIMLELSRIGVQVFFATHDYVMLKWLDLLAKPEDRVMYHALYRGDEKEIHCQSASTLTGLSNNAILDTFAELYDAELDRTRRRLSHDRS